MTMITRKYGITAACLSSFMIFGTAWAGASNSGGGGMLLKDSLNPWFLQNTKEVHYCFAIDSEAFSLSRTQVQAHFSDGIDYWKNEFLKFSSHQSSTNSGFKALGPYSDGLQVGTQNFVEESCGPRTDLTVYLGTLPQSQKDRIGDFDRAAAITLRTAYNRQNLRGQGFIYIAPDLLEDGIIPKGMWGSDNGSAFRLTLSHELGHVFGMPDSGLSNSLMSYNIVDSAIWAYKTWPDPPGDKSSVLDQAVVKLTRVMPKHVRECVTAKEQRVWAPVFGLPTQGPYCWEVAYHDQTLDVLMTDGDDTSKATVVASAKLTVFRKQSVSAKTTLVSMWMPKEQLVFNCKFCDVVAPGLFDDFHFSIVDEVIEPMRGVLTTNKGGRTTPVSLVMSPDAWHEGLPLVSAVVDGNLEPDLFSLIDPK